MGLFDSLASSTSLPSTTTGGHDRKGFGLKLTAFGVADALAAAFAVGAGPAMAATGDGQLGGPSDPSFTADDSLSAPGDAVTRVDGLMRNIGGYIPIFAVMRLARPLVRKQRDRRPRIVSTRVPHSLQRTGVFQ